MPIRISILTQSFAIFFISLFSLGVSLLLLIDYVGLEGFKGSSMQTLPTVDKIRLPFHWHGKIEDSLDLIIVETLLSAGPWKLGEKEVNLFEPVKAEL